MAKEYRRCCFDTNKAIALMPDCPSSVFLCCCRERRVQKEYLAITVGVPQQQAFTVDAAIDRHPSVDTARRILAEGKPALTEFEVRAGWFATVECVTCQLHMPPSWQAGRRASGATSARAGSGELSHERCRIPCPPTPSHLLSVPYLTHC